MLRVKRNSLPDTVDEPGIIKTLDHLLIRLTVSSKGDDAALLTRTLLDKVGKYAMRLSRQLPLLVAKVEISCGGCNVSGPDRSSIGGTCGETCDLESIPWNSFCP
jgi:hypothetical protein